MVSMTSALLGSGWERVRIVDGRLDMVISVIRIALRLCFKGFRGGYILRFKPLMVMK